MIETTYGPCDRCGAAEVQATFDDADLGDRGPFELDCECGWNAYVPAEASARSRIGKLREIDRTGMAARVDGYLVDITTARLLVRVYEALSPANREKFGKLNLVRLVDVAWKVAS